MLTWFFVSVYPPPSPQSPPLLPWPLLRAPRRTTPRSTPVKHCPSPYWGATGATRPHCPTTSVRTRCQAWRRRALRFPQPSNHPHFSLLRPLFPPNHPLLFLFCFSRSPPPSLSLSSLPPATEGRCRSVSRFLPPSSPPLWTAPPRWIPAAESDIGPCTFARALASRAALYWDTRPEKHPQAVGPCEWRAPLRVYWPPQGQTPSRWSPKSEAPGCWAGGQGHRAGKRGAPGPIKPRRAKTGGGRPLRDARCTGSQVCPRQPPVQRTKAPSIHYEVIQH